MLPTLVPIEIEKAELDANPSKQMSHLEDRKADFDTAYEKYQKGEGSILEVLDTKTEFDLAKSMFDETNAYIAEAFGKVVEKVFHDRETEFDQQTGFIKPHQKDGEKTLIGITFPNLPRVNSNEAHNGGNIRLRNAIDVLEKAAANLEPFVIHQRGGDFLTYVETDITHGKQIIQKTEEAEWTPIRATHEKPYLVAGGATLENAITVFNKIQAIRAIENTGDFVTSAHQAKKELTGILLAVVSYQRESKKVQTLCERFAAEVEAGTTTQPELETYFNSYVKTYFESVGYDTYEKTTSLLANKELAGIEIKRIGATRGMASLEEASDHSQASAIISELVVGIAEDQHIDVPTYETVSEHTLALVKLPIKELEIKVRELHLTKEFTNDETHEATPVIDPFTTKHLAQMAELTHALKEVKEAAVLTDDQIENLLKISNYPPQIQTAISQELKRGNPGVTQKFIELSQRRLEIYLVKHDRLTGLPTRYEFYRESNEWLKEAVEKGEQCGMISMDLGFLSYFNKHGNRETGDRAIKASVMQLEIELEKAFGTDWDTHVKIYRYAGDEINILYRGDPSLRDQLEIILHDLNTNGQEIPLAGTTSKKYAPEKIQYNFGPCHIYLGELGLEKLLDSRHIYEPHEEKALRTFLDMRRDLRNADILMNLDFESVYNKGLRDQVIVAANEFVAHHITETDPMRKTYEDAIAELRGNYDTSYLSVITTLKELSGKYYEQVKQEYLEKISSVRINPQEETFFYTTLGRVMTRIGDRLIDHHKTYERFHLLYYRYTEIQKITDPVEKETEKKQLDTLLTFSGKAFFGKKADFLKKVYEEQAKDIKTSAWQIFKKLILEEARAQHHEEAAESRLGFAAENLPDIVLRQLIEDMSLELQKN